MGKNKIQPYQLFVRDEFNRMKRAGQDVVFNSLYQSLDPKWKAMSQERKQWYKDRASNGGSAPGRPPPPTERHPSEARESTHSSSDTKVKPSTSDFSFNPGNNNIKFNSVSLDSDIKFGIDRKPNIEEERGVKRELQLDNIDLTNQEEREHEQPNKKKKNVQGFGVPNWKNIKNSNTPDADRYFDHYLVKLREQCESIVQTRGRYLLDKPLCTFSCNVLCKYKKDGTEVKYIPLEFGIHTYSIKSGQVKPPYHVMIDSGPPPRNYWGDTFDHMTSTHKILVTQAGVYPPQARKDYRTIYKEMLKYVREGERTLLVADTYDLDQVKKSIEWIYEMAALEDPGISKPSTWTILPLIDFVAAMYNFVYVHMLHYPLPKFTLHYFLKVRLETSIWDYDTSLMCSYHKDDMNQTKWCARSCAVRAINALQLTLEEIYKNYKTAEEAEEKSKRSLGTNPDPAVGQAGANQSGTCGAQKTRIPTQQQQQPLNIPEDQEPPPLFEEMAKREELRRRQEDLLQNPPPPPEYHESSEPPSGGDDKPKAIEDKPVNGDVTKPNPVVQID